jgi:hypothetical protein
MGSILGRETILGGPIQEINPRRGPLKAIASFTINAIALIRPPPASVPQNPGFSSILRLGKLNYHTRAEPFTATGSCSRSSSSSEFSCVESPDS